MNGGSGQNGVAAKQLPEAKGDMKYLVGEPFFLYLYNLYLEHGSILRLNFGPKVHQSFAGSLCHLGPFEQL